MPTTPLRGYVIPELSERPYFTKIVDMFNAMDTDMAAALGFRASLTANSSPITATGGANFDKSYTFPAGLLNIAGTRLRIRASGIYSTVAAPGSCGLLVMVGGSEIARLQYFTGWPANASNDAWSLDTALVVRTTGTSGQVMSTGGVGGFGTLYYPGAPGVMATTPQTLNLTAALTVQLFFDTGTTGNSITLRTLDLDVLRASATFS
jgi:hypothetical protein